MPNPDDARYGDLTGQAPLRLSRLSIVAMLVIGVVLVAAIGYLSLENARARALSAEQSEIARGVRDATAELLSQVTDAETGQRGFILTGREDYLEPYNSAVVAVPRILQQMGKAVARQPDQQGSMDLMRPAIDAKLTELAETVTLRREKGIEAAAAVVATDRGKSAMDEIRLISARMREVADRRLEANTRIAEGSAARLQLVSLVGSLVLLVFLIAAALTVRSALGEREQLYYAAAARSEQFRVTLASIGDAVVVTDAQKNVTFINDVACKLTGWEKREALGAKIESVFPIVNETTRAAVENPLDKALKTGSVVGLANHTVLIRKDGAEVPIDDSAAPIRAGKEDAIVGAILVFRDISERRKTERQLKAANAQLTQFVDGAAHDLRAPLRSLNVYAEMLSRKYSEALGGGGQEMLQYISGGARQMNQLLEALVDYAQASHIEAAGHPDSQPPGASAELAVQTVLQNLRLELEATSTQVVVDKLPMVPMRDVHMVQVFQNLIGNAIKYHGERQARIHVSDEETESGWKFAVRDNGIGIQQEYLKSIFEPFKRLHGADVPGSGIGLATCKKIIEGYGGTVWAESTVGEGSTFFFTIPV